MNTTKEISEQEKIERLLMPRYKVIADYPNSPVRIGDIIMPDKKGWFAYIGLNIDKYPHLFQLLEWWEERSVEELPRFVSYPNKETVYKITVLFESGGFRGVTIKGQKIDSLLTYTQPSTESEYIKTNKNNK